VKVCHQLLVNFSFNSFGGAKEIVWKFGERVDGKLSQEGILKYSLENDSDSEGL
jgi:hypothetical protein